MTKRKAANGARTVGSLAPAPYNPRKISDPRMSMLGRSMHTFGDLGGIVFNRRTDRTIGGHKRVEHIPPDAVIAITERYNTPTPQGTVAIGFIQFNGERFAYREVDVDEDTEKAMNIAANKHGGEWDMPKLEPLLADLRVSGFDMDLTGFDQDELDQLLKPRSAREEGPVDLTPPTNPKSKRGEVYELGRHRLMCGDSTSAEDLSDLLGDARAEVLWTDPPYGVKYVGKTKSAKTIKNDNSNGLAGLLHDCLAAVDAFLNGGARFYVASPPGRNETVFRNAVESKGWVLHQGLSWVKDQFVLGHSDYHFRHETILYGWKPGSGRVGRGDHNGTRWYGDHAQDSVFEIPRPRRSEDHPTEKPIALIAQHLLNSSKSGDVVLDIFGGSGSTLIAAEREGRTCYMMELDPAYCDVIRRRYAEYVGRPELAP